MQFHSMKAKTFFLRKNMTKKIQPFDTSNEKILKLHHIPAYFLLFCLLTAFYLFFTLMQPFFTVLIFAAVLATVFYPVYKQLQRVVKSSSFAAFLSCVLVTLVIIIPLIILFFMLATQAFDAYIAIQAKINTGFLDPLLKWSSGGFFFDTYQRYLPDLNIQDLDLTGQITSVAQKVSTFLISQTQNFLSSIAAFFMGFLILGVTLFYFFKDGEQIADRVMTLSPLPNKYEKRLLGHLRTMTRATMHGTFLTAIAQGCIGGIGFAIAGVGQPVLWGTVMAFFALLPYIGTGLVWMPAALILLVQGHTGQAIFLVLWGAIVVGMLDNFLRPYLIGTHTNVNPLLTFLCVLGGIMVWGFPGVIFGPLILTLLVALVEIYEDEYGPILKKLDHHDL